MRTTPTEADHPPAESIAAPNVRWSPGEAVLLALVVLAAALHLPLIFRLNIGWDEFRFLSDMYRFDRGSITSPLQTIHVHLFRWLPSIGAHEVDRIIAARFVYYLLLLGSCTFIYLIARGFLQRAPSLFAVLVYLAYSDVIGHATSFRFDGLSIFLLLASLTLIVRKPDISLGVAGAAVLAAMALLVTIKSVFYFPTLALLLILMGRSATWKSRLSRLGVFAAVGVATSLLLFWIHAGLLPAAEPTEALASVQRAGTTGITLRRLFPRSGFISVTMLANPWTWVLLGLGVAVLLLRRVRSAPGRNPLTMLALLLPLGSLAVYRNTFPYFFIFLMPVAAVLCAVPFDDVLRAGGRRGRWALAGMVLVILSGFGIHYRHHLGDEISAQRRIIETVHRLFPEPVPYIDANAMIGSFPKVGPFMSEWGLEHYHAAGSPMFEQWLLEHAPVFVLAHHPGLHLDDPGYLDPDRPWLFPEDRRVLRENYVHHWETLYVAGKRLDVPAQGTVTQMIVSGYYTVEAEAPILVAGVEYGPGEAVRLDAGPVRLQPAEAPLFLTLRWGRELHRPRRLPPGSVIFRGFYPCASPFAARSACPAAS